MKITYHLRIPSPSQQKIYEYVLLEEIDRQQWYEIILLPELQVETFICIH